MPGGEPGKRLVRFLGTKQEVQHKEVLRKMNCSPVPNCTEPNQALRKEGVWTEILLPELHPFCLVSESRNNEQEAFLVRALMPQKCSR